MHDIEFELDDDEIRFEAEEDPVIIASGGGDFGPPVDVSGEVDEPWREIAADVADDSGYAMRFFELSQREFESDGDRDREIDEILDEMEREYFLGGLLKKVASGAGGMLKKAASSIARNVPGAQALKSVTQLAGSALKGGMLKPFAQAALSFVPGGSMVLPALDALGFGGGAQSGGAAGGGLGGLGSLLGGIGASGFGGGAPDLAKWSNLASMFQDAFTQLAARTESEVTDPSHAMKLATESFQSALRNATSRDGARSTRQGQARRVIYLSPGEEIVIRVRPT